MRSFVTVPGQELKPYVQLIWCLEVDDPDHFGPPERIAPDGIVELVLQYRPGVESRLAGDEYAALPVSALVCQTTRYIEIVPRRPIGFVSVRFRPWGALHFLDFPVAEVGDRILPASEAWGHLASELEERMAAAPDSVARIELVERFLLDRLRRHRKDDVRGAIEAVWRHRGDVRARDLYHMLGVSERTAQRLFNACVGMPPKRYARLTRFLWACATLRRERWSSLAQVAHRCGYYDQAHFDGDFKAYAGMTPRDFVRSQGLSFLEIEPP